MPDDNIVVGVILRPQGIAGEVKINPLTDDVKRFSGIKYLITDDGIRHAVKSVRINGGVAYVRFEDVTDRNAAELLRNSEVSVRRADAVKLPEGRHFIVDIIGCEVLCDGESLGKVTDVLQNGCADVYCVRGAKDLMFPIAEGVILDTDTDKKRIVVDRKRFSEVVCYED